MRVSRGEFRCAVKMLAEFRCELGLVNLKSIQHYGVINSRTSTRNRWRLVASPCTGRGGR
jgi:hypothetical protein